MRSKYSFLRSAERGIFKFDRSVEDGYTKDKVFGRWSVKATNDLTEVWDNYKL